METSNEQKQKSVIIDCSTCESKVAAEVLARKSFFHEEVGEPYELSILSCPKCKEPMLSISWVDWEPSVNGEEMAYIPGPESRLWPDPKRRLPFEAPDAVRSSLEEARKCLEAKAFSACAVMCGKALEALCKEHSVEMRNLSEGLEKLKQKSVIDGRLYEWGQELRKARNIGAHVSDVEISKEDARDVFDFSIAIVDYVYVLNGKYEEFKKRRAARQSVSKPTSL